MTTDLIGTGTLDATALRPSAGGSGPAIVAEGLVRIHHGPSGPVAALRGLDLTVDRGQIVAIVGPSGSGKTSFLRLLAGMEPPDAGRLDVLGTNLATADQAEVGRHRRERVGLVEQHYRRAVTPYLPIATAVAQPLALRGVVENERRARAEALLDRVGLAGRGDARRADLSGGEQQRVAIAIALATRPPLLLADEPTGELDRATAAEVLELLGSILRADGSTAVIVTHDELVETIADRVVHVRDGRAVAERSGRAIRRLTDRHGWLAPPLRSPATTATATPVGADAPGPSAAGRAAATGTAEPAVRREPGPAGAATPAAELDAAERRYATAGSGRTLGLPAVTASLDRGALHALVGPSGSGKSTLLRLIAGLDRPTGGRVVTLGRDLAGLDRAQLAELRGARIGFVDQARDLVPFLDAREIVELGLAIHGRRGPEVRERAAWALDRLGLAGLADRRPDQLSAGERLRVAIARAIAPGPELLLLDEPTAALDRASAEGVARLLEELRSMALTIATATHDAALIEAATNVLPLAPGGAGPRSGEA